MDEIDLPQNLALMREAVMQEICAAFAGVDRNGTVSWSETKTLEKYGCTKDECREARESDRENGWEQLVDDENWIPDTGWGGWAWLEPKGFHYYLPAAMIRCIKTGCDQGIARYLRLYEYDTFTDGIPAQYERDEIHTTWSELGSCCRTRFSCHCSNVFTV
jgi:hypothetical protein